MTTEERELAKEILQDLISHSSTVQAIIEELSHRGDYE